MAIKSAVDCGTLHMIYPADRSTSFDANKSTVDDTWREVDLSALVPNGTKAIRAYIRISCNDANDSMILLVRDGDSTTTDTVATRYLRFSAEIGAPGSIIYGGTHDILAGNGIFYFRRYSSSHSIDAMVLVLHGYYR